MWATVIARKKEARGAIKTTSTRTLTNNTTVAERSKATIFSPGQASLCMPQRRTTCRLVACSRLEKTKTTAATGVEMPPEAESWVQLHESELTELMQKQAKAAITELKRQEKQERKKEKYHNTFTLMKCYRDAVFHIENAISDGQQLELKGMTDEQQRTYLESIRRTRFKTLIMTAHIDKAVEEIERRREAAGRGVEYKAFEMYFMQGMDYAEIAEELDTGKNTPRRWVTGIINELSVLLWGIDEERVK